jgi:hypothetical protein
VGGSVSDESDGVGDTQRGDGKQGGNKENIKEALGKGEEVNGRR